LTPFNLAIGYWLFAIGCDGNRCRFRQRFE
jgi:hypothetical protein